MRILRVLVVTLALAASAAAEETRRVIVGVRIAAEDSAKAERKKRASKAAKEKFFRKHPDLKPIEGHDYEAIPFFTAEVSAKKLAELAADEDVASIEEDDLLEPALADSAGIVGAPMAWSQGRDGSGQVIAILDTGVDAAHPFFGGRVVHQACFSTSTTGYTSACPNGGPSQVGPGTGLPCSAPSCRHGTHVAGIAAGRDPGGVGFSGIARNASIISIQVGKVGTTTAACGGGTPPCVRINESDVINALTYLDGIRGSYTIAAANLSIANFSNLKQTRAACDQANPAYASIVATLREHEIAPVGTAGNNGSTSGTAFPGCITAMINTGATLKTDAVAPLSNSYPGMVDLLAPGDGNTPGSGILSAFPGNGYGYIWGTSMAAPHVAGAIAILRQAASGATVDKMLDDLKLTGKPIQDSRNLVVVPRIDIALALARADTTPPATPGSFAADGSASSVTLTWTASSDDYGLQHYRLERRDSGTGPWLLLGTTTATSYSDAVPAGRAFLYRIAAVDTSGNASPSASDWAVTVTFTTDPIVAGTTVVAGIHQAELRRAADAWRLHAGLPAAFAGYAPLTGPISAADVNAALSAWNGARAALSLPPFAYSGVAGPAPGVMVEDAHVQQMRTAMK